MKLYDGKKVYEGHLTTHRAESSYGFPVVVVPELSDSAYGIGDLAMLFDGVVLQEDEKEDWKLFAAPFDGDLLVKPEGVRRS